ncbi:MAG: hypothetical protein DMF84_22060 [Acidobacteria bacterium]|nr:MAG: hypothetical protein DMF84_22060 [Acidobacteriota bacterium]
MVVSAPQDGERNRSSARTSALAPVTQAPGRLLAVDRRHAAALQFVIARVERLTESDQFST